MTRANTKTESFIQEIEGEPSPSNEIASLTFEAMRLGLPLLQLEDDATTDVAQAADLASRLLERIAVISGGLRGQRATERRGGHDVIVKNGVRVRIDTGEFQLDDWPSPNARPDVFQQFWKHMLPQILRDHVQQLNRDTRAAHDQTNVAQDARWTLWAILGLLEVPVPGHKKLQLVERMLNDPELQDAALAAHITGMPDAIAKLLGEQAMKTGDD